jgi:Fe-S-cluster containining protein
MSKLCKNCKDNCCIHENGGTFITLHESLRIAKALKISVDDVCEFIQDKDLKTENDYLHYYNMFITIQNKIIPLSYKKYTLVLKHNGKKCKFLGEKGCTISKLRPAYCHIYPFWFKEDKNGISIYPMKYNSKEEETCLIYKKYFNNKNYTNIISEINETPKSLLKIISKFIEEVKIFQTYAPELYKGIPPSVVCKEYKIEKSL